MQLILETEPTLSVDTDMSTIEDIQNDKVGKGEINDLNINTCNGNKENIENIGDVKVIVSDDLNKQVTEEVGDSVDRAAIDLNPDESINSHSPKNSQIEESQNETNNVNVIQDEVNNVLQETELEAITDVKENLTKDIQENIAADISELLTEDEDDIITIKDDNINLIKDVADQETENAVVENGTITHKDDVLLPNDDVQLIEEKLETPIITATPTIPNDDVKLIEEKLETPIITETPTITNDDVELIEEELETPIKTETPTISNNDVEQLDNLIKKATPKNENTDDKPNNSEPETEGENKKHIVNGPVEDKTPDNESQVTLQEDVQDSSPIELKDDMDVEEIVDEPLNSKQNTDENDTVALNTNNVDKPVCKLNNVLDIFSDEEEELPNKDSNSPKEVDSNDNEKQCINIEDDDDIMLIDEDNCKTEIPTPIDTSEKVKEATSDVKTDLETGEKTVETEDNNDLFSTNSQKELTPPPDVKTSSLQIDISEKQEEKEIQKQGIPLLPENFIKSAKKNLSDMTRDDLEEFCILKIVESIVDRSSLSEIKIKLKSLTQALEEQKKKALAISKQNRDLQVVLKSVQEEQKKITPDSCITPLKITRSVGLQVIMEKSGGRRKPTAPPVQQQVTNNISGNRQNIKNSPAQSPRQPKAATQPIPVPRLVPANNTANKPPNTIPQLTPVTPNKSATSIPNGIKNPSPSQKVAEKRQHNRTMSVTVDLTDDEPPAKMNNRSSPAPPVRLVPSQNLMAPRQQFAPTSNSTTPRKVYIPISCPINQNIRPGQTVVLKPVPTPGLRPRGLMSQGTRGPSTAIRLQSVAKLQSSRHPAPLPDAMKQYQPPNWKALPPAPDLKLSKVENGIVISWKIEDYQEDSYEEIASYQLYAYQETPCPPSTSLWKKIGDVKALPLPMACTLTQFMAGFKYYFAVRAVDIRSRLGPFSLPGSILLLNKL